MNTKTLFDKINKTGVKFIAYKVAGKCYCVKSDGDIFEQLPDALCTNCLGTGKARKLLLTENVRYVANSDGNEEQNFERNKESDFVVYFNSNYEFTTSDILAIPYLDESNNVIMPIRPELFFKVVGVTDFVAENFKYLKVYITQIGYLPYKEIIDELWN